MERVTVKFAKDRFDLCIGGRYTIVVGMSGEGKTWLASVANRCFEEPEYAYVTGKYKSVATAGSKHWMPVFRSNVDIVVIDEDEILDDDGDISVFELMRKYQHHYLILSRAGVHKVPFGVSDVYDMVKLSERYAHMVPHAWREDLLRPAVSPANHIKFEDSKSGYIAAQESYKRCAMVLEPGSGKGDLTRSGIKSGYLAADLCGLGITAFNIDGYLSRNPNVQLCDIISFEAECLRSQNALPELPEDVVSAEAFYGEALKSYLLSRYNLTYSKGNEDVVRALISGFYSHAHRKLEGWGCSDWWVPGVPHNDIQWLLKAYHDTFDEEYTGVLPSEVSAMSDEELHRNAMDILIKMHKTR